MISNDFKCYRIESEASLPPSLLFKKKKKKFAELNLQKLETNAH